MCTIFCYFSETTLISKLATVAHKLRRFLNLLLAVPTFYTATDNNKMIMLMMTKVITIIQRLASNDTNLARSTTAASISATPSGPQRLVIEPDTTGETFEPPTYLGDAECVTTGAVILTMPMMRHSAYDHRSFSSSAPSGFLNCCAKGSRIIQKKNFLFLIACPKPYAL